MRVGVLGGSFDPIHRGHVETAADARGALNLDQVLFVPTAMPPHKDTMDLAPAWQRYAMVELALLDLDWATVSARELTAETCYTIDTLESFKAANPETDWVLLIGGDSLAELTTWRRWRELLRFEIGVLDRPCSGCPAPGTIPDDLARVDGSRIRWVDNRRFEASASEIRSRLAAGERPDDLHPRVLQYILKYSLYQ